VGVHSPISSVIIAGILIHIVTGTSIGIISGIFLYKTNILNISKPSNGLRYGLLVGALVYLIFAIPVEQFVLNPEFGHTLSKLQVVTLRMDAWEQATAKCVGIFGAILLLATTTASMQIQT
jgi:hypothetical protein